MRNAADILIEKVNERSNPCVVGLDPRLASLPAGIRSAAREKHGNTLQGVCSAIVEFNRQIIDAICDVVAVVKPQAAFYGMYGQEGIRAFEETIRYAQKKGMLAIGDSKVTDISSTAEAYAAGHLGEVELFEGKTTAYNVDWMTVNPYMGDDGVNPFIKVCDAYAKGIFVLVKTSNPSSEQFQNLPAGPGGEPLYVVVARALARLAGEHLGDSGYSCVGAVAGATYPREAAVVREIMRQSFLLVPGIGKQGGAAEELGAFFNSDGYGALVSSSRNVIFAFEKTSAAGGMNWASAVRAAALELRDTVLAVLKGCGKLPKG